MENRIMSASEATDQNHPLFDRTSLYRLAVEETTFRADNGEQSLRDYFQARRRRELHRQWAQDVPDQPQDWGFGPAVDLMIHEHFKLKLNIIQINLEQFVLPQSGARSADQTPALLVFRFDLGLEDHAPTLFRAASKAEQPFTGCGEEGGGYREIGAFAVIIDQDHGQGLPDGHLVLSILVTQTAIEMLRPLVVDEGETLAPMARGETVGDAEAIRTITRALSATRLTARRPRLRALRLCNQLALCPALQGIVREGAFAMDIELDADCPSLEDGTYLVLCIGPRAEIIPAQERL
jgi:hypothetical protein